MKKHYYDAYSGYHYSKYRKRFDDYCDDECVFNEAQTEQNAHNMGKADRSHYIIYGELSDGAESPKKPSHFIQDTRSCKNKGDKNKKTKAKTSSEKSRKHRANGTAIVICLVIMCFSLTVICADIFGGGALFAKYVSFLGINNDSSGTPFYALYMYSAEDINTAYTYSTLVRAQGAAGYVIKQGNIYNVVANIYAKKSDADSVNKKISGSAVLELDIKDFDKSKFPDRVKNSAENCKNIYKTVYGELYGIGASLESGNTTDAAARTQLQSLLTSTAAYADSYAESASGMSETVVLEYKVQLNSIISALQNLTDTSLPRPSLLADVRYYSCLIIHNYYGFAKEYM